MYCELEPSPWSGPATPFRRKGLRQTPQMSLCQRPIDMAIETCLTREESPPVKPKPPDAAWKQN